MAITMPGSWVVMLIGMWLCLAFGGQRAEAYHFPSGFVHHYTYVEVSNVMDQRNVSTILKFHIQRVGEEAEEGRSHLLLIDSFVQIVPGAPVLENPGKWDLSKAFIFVMKNRSSIELVHVHPEDRKELMVAKKSLSSLFSVHIQEEEGKEEWSYSSQEADHLGDLKHEYTVRRTAQGLTLHRQHASVDMAHRFHYKTLHYDHHGILQSAAARDRVLWKDRTSGERTKKVIPGGPSSSTPGDFPDMEVVSHAIVEYSGQKKVERMDAEKHRQMLATLRPEKLQTRHEKARTNLEKVQQNITNTWDCIHSHPQEDSENRSACVNKLREILKDLNTPEYKTYVGKILGKTCGRDDAVCEDDRLVLLDIVTRLGDVSSQTLVVTYVLSKRPPVDEELRRVFIHCAAMERPTKRFVAAVAKICFGDKGELHGQRKLGRTQGRACLAVGSLVKHLASSGQQNYADNLAHRLEIWLDKHGKGDVPIKKRETTETRHAWMSEEEEAEHIGKAVLLHSLGNSALERSKSRLMRHATPNSGHHIWRRAALDALRHYKCHESADVMFRTATQDEKPSVRRMAFSVFMSHPRRHDVTRDEESDILSKNYTYRAVTRVKRSVVEKVLFRFKVEIPSYEWSKEIGSSKIGASAGVKFHNSIEGAFRWLSGYVDVDVHNKLWAEAHVGLLDWQVDILFVEICYKGRLSYNLNIVKDYTVDLTRDVNSVFDHIINEVMEPIKNFSEAMVAEYEDVSTGQPRSGFQPLADAVKNLPSQTSAALLATTEFNEEADLLGSLPLVKKLQALTSRAQSVMEDVHCEASEIFTDLADVAEIGLPFAEKEIRTAINSTLGVLGRVRDSPRQAFTVIERAKLRYQLALLRIVEGKKIIKEVFSFFSGGRSSWNNAGEELRTIIDQTRSLVSRIRDHYARRKKRQVMPSAANFYSQCGSVNVEDTLTRLYNKSEVMIRYFEVLLQQSPAELQHALDRMNQQSEVLKDSFAGFKEAIDIIRSRMNALFGVKFHPQFPSQRRDCDSQCGCGYYPTDCNRYGHPGIDVVWNKGWKVVNPVSGMVHQESRNSVRIEPHTADLQEYQIFISNIELTDEHRTQTDFYLEAGEVLGHSLGASGCMDDHIHIAMKRTSNDTGMCHYLDPSPFLDTPQPSPTWHEECREFTLKHLGQTVDSGAVTDGFGSKLTELKRMAMEWAEKARTFVQDLFPDDSFLAPLKDGFVFDVSLNLDSNASSLAHLFNNTRRTGAANAFFKALSSTRLPFRGFIQGSMQNSKMRPKVDRLPKVAERANTLVNIGKKPARPLSRSLGAVYRLISSAEFDYEEEEYRDLFGDVELPPAMLPPKGVLPAGRDQLMFVLRTKLRSAVCPVLGKQLANQDSPCMPHQDCLGLACEITIRRTHASETVNVDIRLNRDSNTLDITLRGQTLSVPGNASKVLPTRTTVFGVFDVKLKVKTSWGEDALLLSLSIQACGPNLCCLPDVHLAKNLFFSNLSVSDLRHMFNNSDFNLDELSLEQTFKVLADLNVDSPELAQSIIGLKELVRDSLKIKLPPESDYKTEFEDPVEYSDGGRFPVSGQKAQVYIPFIGPLVYPIPVGIWFVLLHVSGGGAIGFEYAVYVQTVDSTMWVGVSPWVSAKIEAGVSLDIFVVSFGVGVHGWLMKTKFPVGMEANYTKLPIVTTTRLEVELIPVTVRLFVWVEIKLQINLFFVTITIFHKKWDFTIFYIESPGIKGTIWEKVVREDDDAPPRFPTCASVSDLCTTGRRRRSVDTVAAQCQVRQLQGRDPKDVALRLEFSAEDDTSDLDLSYAVGDYPGGSNIRSWTSMRTSPLLVLGSLPCGKPLHFLVRAVNSQGMSRVASCQLPTLDCTLPDGRVDSPSLCTSHRTKLSATVVVYDDSPLQVDQLFSAVGYGPGSHSHEAADWTPLLLDNMQQRPTVSGNLRYFSSPRLGRLAASPVKTLTSPSVSACAGECLKVVSCLSFSFDEFLYSCELQSVTEGLLAERVEDGEFFTYERLGNGYSADVEYSELALRHGVRYYVNSVIQNVMGYQSVLTSPGIMVDHTPPEAGYVGEGAVDETVMTECSTSVIQRCSQPEELLAHRKVIDGKGASTVFNGNRRGQNIQFTYENHHASANWDGFTDEECGIYGYAWAVGTSVCGSDVSNFTDPHQHHSNPQDWTHVGVAKDLHLAEGPYYVTIQAVNDIAYGGDLVTTVCHSTPFVVDITPPVLHSVSDVIFDDGFRILAVYFNATDNLSGVGSLEFGLGKTKYDVMVRRYMPFEIRGSEDDRYLMNEEFETASGTPAWIRLKVVDNVGLSAAGHGASPILLDSTAPLAGDVLDGENIGHDTCCQAESSSFCVQWRGFEDPESHIQKYLWGVGSTAGKDDVAPFRELSAHDHRSCVSGLSLRHNATYYSTVIAFNKALNQKIVNASSDGVLVDVTPPRAGIVVDGSDLNSDLNYTSETASVTSSWTGFHDPETDIDFYTLSVLVNGVAEHNVTNLVDQTFTDHSFSLTHGDEVKVKVTATNRAGSIVAVTSDGLKVDHTPPGLLYLNTADGASFQQNASSLHFIWDFEDLESGLAEYRVVVYQLLHRSKTKFWPLGDTDQQVVKLGQSTWNSTQNLTLSELSLINGATYSVKVTAVNWASLATVEETKGVTVDTSPPVVEHVQISMLGDDEEVNEAGEVEHIEGEPIYVSWKAHDFESSLISIELCIGPQGSECLTSNNTLFLDASSLQSPSTVLSDADLLVSTDDNKVLYQVSLAVINGAGVRSVVAHSKPIMFLQGNVAGLVLDGRSGRDEDFTNDKAAIAATFASFSSVACGIEGYDWGVGSAPFATDILPYSSSGLVTDASVEGSGKAQAHLMLTEGKTYYVTVRARTGHACHEPYIVSCSDGITIDTAPPSVAFFPTTSETDSTLPSSVSLPPPLSTQDVVIQTTGDRLQLGWDVRDESGVNTTVLNLDLFGSDSKTLLVPSISLAAYELSTALRPGGSFYSSLWAVDSAGNEVKTLLPAVMVDSTPASFLTFNCTEFISSISLLLTCTWSVSEIQSFVQEVQLGLGSGKSFADLLNMTSVPLHANYRTYDLTEIWASHLRALSDFYVIANTTNTAGLTTTTSWRVRIDVTPPDVSEVIVVTSPAPVNSRTERLCQTSHDFIEIELRGLTDDESGVQSVDIALGSSPGATDIHPFQQYTLVEGVYANGGLGLPLGATVFATARVTNGVGLYTIVNSKGVVISPQPRLLVVDGPGLEDADGQADVNLIQGQWMVTDPCPILSASWWVTELGSGRVIRKPADLVDNSRSFFDDTLSLENLKTYVVHVRVTDAVSRTWEAWSDGVTVSLDSPATARVWEGVGPNDIDYQESLNQITATWEPFGNPRSPLPSDQVVRYEVAVGTDPQERVSRSDVHAFQDVGLATAFTFHGLNLTAKTVLYYVTVRAYSAAGSFSESSSDGIRVGYSGEILSGRLMVDSYQSDNSSIRTAWDGFVSDFGELGFYLAVSSLRPPWDNSTRDCGLILNDTSSFDIKPLGAVDAKSLATMQGLGLAHNRTFYVTVVAEDLMAHCSAVVSDPILVDTTPPESGNIVVQGYDTDTVTFLHTRDTIFVDLTEFLDQESGIETTTVELHKSLNCGLPTPQDLQVGEVTAIGELQITMRDLDLDESGVYYLKVIVKNKARLETQATSKPLLVSVTPPKPGVVKLGTKWTGEEPIFSSQTNTLTGMIAVSSVDAQTQCITDIDLTSNENRPLWEALPDNFTNDCVFVEETGISLLLQHDKHLTGVDRGAVQVTNLFLVEGNYTFRMTAASGQRILTGVSLSSPSLLPPFLAQSKIFTASDGCDTTLNDCGTEGSNQSRMVPENEYGLGLSFAEVDGAMKTLFWAQDGLRLKQTWVSLDFDPTTTSADYVFSLKSVPGGRWEVALFVNDELKAGFMGLKFLTNLTLTIYTWNLDDYFPPVTDPLSAFRSVSKVTVVKTPVWPRPKCSYGSPFFDNRVGIREVWVGVSSSFNQTADVAPFRLLKSFCMPCLHGCTNICSASCQKSLSSGYNVLPLSLTGLSLTAANDAMRDSTTFNSSGADVNASISEVLDKLQLPMYYLDVKVTSQSGHVTVAKSSALTIDTSPPVVNTTYCIDPAYDEGQAVEYIGTNSSVGLVWDVSEDVSEVASQWLCLGTQSGVDDVAPWVEVDRLAAKHVFKDLIPKLTDRSTYHLSLRVLNAAGLSATTSVVFTVNVSPPDVSIFSPAPSNVAMVTNVSGESVAFTGRTDTVKLSLNFSSASGSSDNPPVLIEWSIGSQPGKDDIFPRSVVANRNVTSVAIVNGYVELEGQATNITVEDFVSGNFRQTNHTDPVRGALFRMEPGRCLRQSMFGISRSHTVAEGPSIEPVCIQRDGDQLVLAGNTSLNVPQSQASASPQPPSKDIKIHISLTNGGLLIGSLHDEDLNAVYGTAASTEFVPFVVLPDPQDRTSRVLRKRLFSFPGPSMYVSPVADVQFEGDLDITIQVPSTAAVPPGADIILLFWVAESQEWKSLLDLCPFSIQIYNNLTRLIESKVCFEVFVESSNNSNPSDQGGSRRKRSADNPAPASITLTPRMFTVAVVGPVPPNTPPTVSNTSLVLREDDVKKGIVITYSDDEDDAMTFTLLHPPLHGTATVTSDGRMTYVPHGDYFGNDVIVLQGVEKLDEASKRAGIVPNVVNVSVTVSVAGVNDPPNLFYLTGANSSNVAFELNVGPAAGNGINMSVLVEGNTTTFVDLGLIVFGDLDANDTLIFVNRTRDDVNATFEFTDVSLEDPRLSGLNVSGFQGGVGARAVMLRLDQGYHGEVSYDVRVRDAAGSYSLQLMLGVHVMISPCVYGHCEATTPTGSCLDPQRAFTFDLFRCHCYPGYEGEWCQTETDECRKATCSPVTDCVDLINGYRCDANAEKTAAIVICSVLAVLLIAAAVFMIRRNRNRKKSDKEKSQKGRDSKGNARISQLPTGQSNWAIDNRAYTGFVSGDMMSTSNSRQASAYQPIPKSSKYLWRPWYAQNVSLDEALPGPSGTIWRPQQVENIVTDEGLMDDRYPPWDADSWNGDSEMPAEKESEGWTDLPRVDNEGSHSHDYPFGGRLNRGFGHEEPLVDTPLPDYPPFAGNTERSRQAPLDHNRENPSQGRLNPGFQHEDLPDNTPSPDYPPFAGNTERSRQVSLVRLNHSRENPSQGRLNPGFQHEDPLDDTPSPDYPPFAGSAGNNTSEAEVYAVPLRKRTKE